VKLLLDVTGAEQEDISGTLHDGAAGRRHASHEQRHADDAFEADDRNLGRRPVFKNVQQGDHAAGREVQYCSFDPDS
jgi:hypothetical protein